MQLLVNFFFLQLLDLKMKEVGLHPQKLQNIIFFVKIFRSKVGHYTPTSKFTKAKIKKNMFVSCYIDENCLGL